MGSLYDSRVKTRLIDPVYNKSNFRSVFELDPNTVFSTKMRLTNVGQYGTASTYNPLTGSYGTIEAIRLMDGAGTVLDQVHDFSIWMGFKNKNAKMMNVMSVNDILANTDNGLIAVGIDLTANNGVELQDEGLNNTLAVADSGSASGWLDLRRVFNLLRSTSYLPTNVFKNLRIEIDWKTSANLKNNMVDSTGNDSTKIPVLIVDEIVDMDAKMELMKKWASVSFYSIESERVTLDAVANLDNTEASKELAQEETFLMNGFQNKFVNRILMVRSPTDSATWRDGTDNIGPANQSSFTVYKPKFQVRLNGKDKLAGSGWTQKNQQLGQLVDTWGNVTSGLGENLTNLTNKANYYGNPSNHVGKFDYTGFHVDEYVQDMQMTVGRSGVYAAANANDIINQKLNILVYGECLKSVIRNNNGYNIVYNQ